VAVPAAEADQAAPRAQVELPALAGCQQLQRLHLEKVNLEGHAALSSLACLQQLALLRCTQEHSIAVGVTRVCRELQVGVGLGRDHRQRQHQQMPALLSACSAAQRTRSSTPAAPTAASGQEGPAPVCSGDWAGGR
jgi:hypothetical protein